MLTWNDFKKVEMRVGTILDASLFPEAHKAAYKITIDLGPLGIRKTSAQITELYDLNELIGKQVVVVTNFPNKQIANFMSECLILGAISSNEKVTLLTVDKPASNGDLIS